MFFHPEKVLSKLQSVPADENKKAHRSELFCLLAGVQGFEPRYAGIRNQSLTAWRHPNNLGTYDVSEESGWGAGIRTPVCWYQKPEPYRLATPHQILFNLTLSTSFTTWLECRDSNPGMLVSETRALPLGDTPRIWWLRRDSNL
jgi:hypothetical protein